MEKFDVCIIGGGPAGYAAAMRAIDFRKRVLLIEQDKIGGAGLFNGALSSKALWEYSEKIATIREMIGDEHVNIGFREMQGNMQAAVNERKEQLVQHLKILKDINSQQLLHFERGKATLVSKNEVKIEGKNGDKIIWAEFLLIATGSRPRKLQNVVVDEKHILTSDGISELTALPESLVILGAGIVGCEFATIFSNIGKTNVYLIDKADRILPFEDADVAGLIANNFKQKGVIIHGNAKLERLEVKDGEVEYEISYAGGKKEVLRVEKALLSIGRVPNVEDLGLEKAGVKLTDRGYIYTNDTQTNVSNIFAAGDVCGKIALVNIAEREARHAIYRMFGPPVKPLDYNNISTIMFLHPEVAAVGLNEQDAMAQGIPIKVAKIDYSCLPRAIAMRKTTGFFKMIVSNDSGMRILGMRAVGEHASSAIEAVALLIYMNKGIQELGHMLHPHPAITEGIQECARLLLGKPLFKSSVFRDKIQCYSCENGVCTPLEKI